MSKDNTAATSVASSMPALETSTLLLLPKRKFDCSGRRQRRKSDADQPLEREKDEKLATLVERSYNRPLNEEVELHKVDEETEEEMEEEENSVWK